MEGAKSSTNAKTVKGVRKAAMMAPIGVYHGCFSYSCLFSMFQAHLQKPGAKQASKKTFIGHMTMLSIIADSFCYGIYKGYNHKKLV